jgi:GTP-dependent phosphoenolpyruvate carboxykinase
MDLSKEKLFQLLSVDGGAWLEEADRALSFLGRFGGHLPAELITEHRGLVKRLHESRH